MRRSTVTSSTSSRSTWAACDSARASISCSEAETIMKTTIAIALILSGGVTSAFAQAQVNITRDTPAASAATLQDARFNTWLGCWRLEDDLAGTGARMCITPEGKGVRMQT